MRRKKKKKRVRVLKRDPFGKGVVWVFRVLYIGSCILAFKVKDKCIEALWSSPNYAGPWSRKTLVEALRKFFLNFKIIFNTFACKIKL